MIGSENGEEMQTFIGGMQGDSLNSLVFRMIHRYGSLNFSKFQKLGVHPGQLPVFAILRGHEGVSLREMADLLHIKPPTVTVTIQRLEKAGLVIKKPDGKDQRINRIYLTEKGKNLSEEIQFLAQENEQILMEGFSAEELELLKDFLHRMIGNLAAAGGECARGFPGRAPFSEERCRQCGMRPDSRNLTN